MAKALAQDEGFDARPWVLLAPALLALFLLMVVPMAIIFVFTFYEYIDVAVDRPAFQFENWRWFFQDSFYHYAIWQTLRISAITTLVCVLLGFVPAYFIANTTYRHKWLLMLLLILPFWVSFIIRQLSWVHVLGSQGIVNATLLWLGIIDEPLGLLYNEATVVMGLVHFLLPFMILNIYVSLEGIDRNLVSAARTLGCTEWQAFREVTLPLSLPGLAAGSLLCFVLAGGSYVTPLILGGPDNFLFGNLIYDTIMMELNWPMGATLSVVLLVLLGSLVVIYGRFMGLSRLYKSLN
ncbi:ABC transporter permease [Aquibaculum sediminis]|uniref:ABC transporter permease n=1 Tax=Aquibaculum sediminis TaxID=3231907 RepID=UPI0034512EAA